MTQPDHVTEGPPPPEGKTRNGHLLVIRSRDPYPYPCLVCRCCGQTAETETWFAHRCVRAGEISPLIPSRVEDAP